MKFITFIKNHIAERRLKKAIMALEPVGYRDKDGVLVLPHDEYCEEDDNL